MIKEKTVFLNDDGSIMRAAAPESVGISSAAVLKMLESLEKSNFQYHSFMLVRGGKVAAECYRSPFTKNSAHTMYSVSKTVTSTAIGFAVDEGLLSLDTRVIDIFPEYRKPKEKNSYIDEMTIRHLLSMMSGKLPNVLLSKTDRDWLKHLFNAKWVSQPGTKFDYVNENMFALCAALQRVSGMSVVDYLMPRLFEPLKIERPQWETDFYGVEAGGWGIFLKTEDLAKLMLCYHCGGRFGGRQVIPAAWVPAATCNQHGQTPPVREEGYGYGIWVRNENEYYAGGMFCQISYIFEKEDCAAVVTACSPADAPFMDALEILRAEGFIEPDEAATPSDEFIKAISTRQIDTLPQNTVRSALEKELNDKELKISKSLPLNIVGFPPGVLHLAAVYMSNYRAGNIDRVSFNFNGEYMWFSWHEGRERNSVKCALNGTYAYTPIVLAHTRYTAAATAFWENERTLNVWLRPVESLCCRKLKFTFAADGTAQLKLTSSPPVADIVESVSWEIHAMVKNKRLDFLADKAIEKLTEITEPCLRGKFKQ